MSLFVTRALGARRFVSYSSRRTFSFARTAPTPWFTRSRVLLGLAAGTVTGASLLVASSPAPIYLETPQVPDTKLDLATSIPFPLSITPAGSQPLTLLGLGVRTVSFLRVKVYVAGFYADLEGVQIPPELSFDEKIDWIVQNRTCAVRIVPTRSTSYSHMRDAFLRSLQARRASARTQKTLAEDEDDTLETPLQQLKSVFPTTDLKKHTPLVIYSSPSEEPRVLIFEGLGEVKSTWIVQNFFKAYFAESAPSPPLLDSVKEFLEYQK